LAESRTIPPKMKERLIKEAGYKCANPGCPVTSRFEIHHINEWAVYQTHDEEHMIALCPTCHSNVNYGQLKITDQKLYEWKRIKTEETPDEKTDQIFVKQNNQSCMLIGPMTINSKYGAIPVRMINQIIQYRIEGKNLYFLNMRLTKQDGSDFFTATHNILVSNISAEVTYKYIPGKLLITSNSTDGFLPDWAIKEIRKFKPGFANNDELTIIDMEVNGPGTVSINSLVMAEGNGALVVYDNEIIYVVKDTVKPMVFSELFEQVPLLFPKVVDYNGSDNYSFPYIDLNPYAKGSKK